MKQYCDPPEVVSMKYPVALLAADAPYPEFVQVMPSNVVRSELPVPPLATQNRRKLFAEELYPLGARFCTKRSAPPALVAKKPFVIDRTGNESPGKPISADGFRPVWSSDTAQ